MRIRCLLRMLAWAGLAPSFRAGRVRVASGELGSVKMDYGGLAGELPCPAQLAVGADVSLG